MLQEHFRNIVPEAEVDARVAMYSKEAEEELLEGKPDFVLDAIDNIDTKVALLAACRRRGVPVLCAAGAGAYSVLPPYVGALPIPPPFSGPCAQSGARVLP